MAVKKVIFGVVKWLCIAAATLTVAAVVAIGLCVGVLTPARLTPIVRDAAAETLPGVDIGLSRAELTFWHTFPRLYVDLDSLRVDNPSFQATEGREIVGVNHLHGGVDIVALLAGEFRIYDVELSGMRADIVVRHDSVSNIAPLLSTSTAGQQEPTTAMPDFSINRFDIVDSLVVEYRQPADSLYFSFVMRPSRVLAETTDGYDIDVKSNMTLSPALPLTVDGVGVEVTGRVGWTPRNPSQLALADFKVGVDGIPACFDAELDFADVLTLKSGHVTVGPVSFEGIRRLVDEESLPAIKPVDTDMRVTLTATLDAPYAVMPDTVVVPDMHGSIEIPDCSLAYDRLKFNGVKLMADYAVDGSNPDRSKVVVRTFNLKGKALSATFEGVATRLLSDPALDGKVGLKMALGRLPEKLMAKYGVRASGDVSLDAKGRFRLSDLSRDNFYRADLKGRLTFDDINVLIPDSGVSLYSRRAMFGLGTQTSYKGAENSVDSLLMASVTIDTLSVGMKGLEMTVAGVKGGFGCENRPPSADTAAIIPLGAGLKVARLNIVADDSVKMGLRQASITGKVLSYQGNAKLPQFSASASAGAIMATDGHSFVALIDGDISADAHQRQRLAVADSLRRRPRRHAISTDTVNTVEFADRAITRLFNRWHVTGHVVAGRGMMYSPSMPLRNRVTELNLAFSSDSVMLRSLKYQGGRSDFSVTGSITNLRRALNRLGDMVVRCRIESDTLDVDQLLHAAAAGSDYNAGNESATLTGDLDKLADMEVDDVDTTAPLSAILIPKNIDADLDIEARHVMYSLYPVRNFSGCLMMKGGALNLTNLHADSEMGSVDMSALYSAPDKSDIRFGLGLQMERINVSEFVKLMPAVDSVMPLLSSFKGIINADIAVTARLDSMMDIELPTLDAAVKLSGDSLSLLDAETFRTLKKWLRFKGRDDNQIEHMDVEMLIKNSTMEIFPFVFNFDRYRLAVMGSNDLNLNFKYHVSVLKSPLPFKFGINLSGNPDDMKVSLGGAKYKDGMAGQSVTLVDTTRTNLLDEMQRVFRSGAARRLGGLKVAGAATAKTVIDSAEPALTRSDSLLMMKEGLIERPDTIIVEKK